MIKNIFSRLFMLRSAIILSVSVVLLSVALCPPVMCAGEDAGADSGNTVRVGYYENEVFEEGACEGAVKTGYAYEYYCKISEYTGWNYEYVYGSFDELYGMLLKGDIDLLAGLAKKDDRVGIIGYPDLAMGNEAYSLVKHDYDDGVTSEPESFAGKSIGVLKSAIADVLEEYLKSYNVKADIVCYDDYETLFHAFDADEIDILAAEGDGAYGREHAAPVCIFGTSDYYLCVSITRNDLLAELNNAQSRLSMDESNYIPSLRSKYYSASVSSQNFSSVEMEWMESHDRLNVGYLNNYLPYSDTDNNGHETGMIKEIIPTMFEKMGVKNVDIQYSGYTSYDDMIEDIRQGMIDVAFPVGGGLYYSEENGIYQSAAVVSASTDLVYKGNYEDDDILHFAVNENNRMQYYYISNNFPDAKISMYPSIDDCLEAVLSGETGATTLNGLRANDILKNSRYRGLYLKQLSNVDDRSFGVKIGNEGLLKLLNRGINVLGTEYAQSIAYDYACNLYSYTFMDMVKDNIWLFLTVILVIGTILYVLIMRDLKRSKLASRLKSDFVSNMSHEIRTPITAILGMNELIQRESDDEVILGYSDNIEKAGESLLSIINDILDFSKIEAGRMELVLYDYSLAELISGLCVMIEHRAREKGLEFETQIDDRLPSRLNGDEQKIRQVITNLLTNAVKYTEEGSVKLTVSLVSTDGNDMLMRVVVDDTGIGIREEEMDKLYSAFDRLDMERTKNIEGSGLGLAITKQLLSFMGSGIHVESVYGKGSSFSFELKQGIADRSPIGDFSSYVASSYEKNKRIRGHENETFTAQDARVLIVDDTPVNLQVVAGLLKRYKIKADTAGSGIECIELSGRNSYDIIFLDQRMPKMDGVETLMELKRTYPDAMDKTSVISLTANAMFGVKEQMIKAGFTDYLTKPVNVRDMENILLKYLPAEKIIRMSDASAENNNNNNSDRIIPEGIEQIEYLDISKGIEYCGDEEEYMEALDIFRESVEKKAGKLEQCFKKNDMEAFSLLVHSLKSSAGSIGFTELSDRARELEVAAEKGDTDTVRQGIGELLRIYRFVGEKLDDVLQ